MSTHTKLRIVVACAKLSVTIHKTEKLFIWGLLIHTFIFLYTINYII